MANKKVKIPTTQDWEIGHDNFRRLKEFSGYIGRLWLNKTIDLVLCSDYEYYLAFASVQTIASAQEFGSHRVK